MPLSHDDALAVQRRHESDLMALPGVTGVSLVLRDPGLVLEVSVDPDAPLPPPLADRAELDGLPLSVVRQRFEPL